MTDAIVQDGGLDIPSNVWNEIIAMPSVGKAWIEKVPIGMTQDEIDTRRETIVESIAATFLDDGLPVPTELLDEMKYINCRSVS